MGIDQAQEILRRQQQQIMQQQAPPSLKPKKFFDTPFDEEVLRQQVLGQVMGFYGGGQQTGFNPFAGFSGANPIMSPYQGFDFGGVGDPRSLYGGAQTDKFSGGMTQPLPPMQSGANPPDFLGGMFGTDLRGGSPDGKITGGGFGLPSGSQFTQMPAFGIGADEQPIQFDSMPAYGTGTPKQQGGTVIDGVYIPSLDNPERFGTRGAQSAEEMMQMVMSDPYTGIGSQSFQSPFSGQGGTIRATGDLGQMNNPLNAITNAQMSQLNADYQTQQQELMNNLFGRGINASTVAADAGGRLLSGRANAMNQITGQAGERELAIRQQLLQAELERAKTGGGVNFGGGRSGGGAGAAGTALGNLMKEVAGSDAALNFEQRMQKAQLELQQAELEQRGKLGSRELDIQDFLGRGGLYYQGQDLSQDFMSQLLGQGFQRQAGAAGLAGSERERLTQYLTGQQQQSTQLAGQQAQLEAQRRSFLSQLMSGLAGFGGALAQGAGQAGGFSQLFGV